MRREARQSLQATALVHEAYLRLLGEKRLNWNDKAHLIGIAARSMRQTLVERARARRAKKRGGDQHPVTLIDEILGQRARSIDLIALDQALQALAELDPKQAQLVELRFFGGLTLAETSEVMGISPATVKRWWALSRAWLRRELGQ
jgi:RNA polymerase sigma factor (TIGR02999 family)